jgi:uncharacterized SAM-binding protein YcdF (DUF218 family)
MPKESLADLVPDGIRDQFTKQTEADQERLFRLLNVDSRGIEGLEPADVVVVLGTAPNAFPEKFQARVDKAVELWRHGLASWILCTGGNDDEFCTEDPQGLLLKRAIVKKGVPEEIIDIEPEATSALENITKSQPIMKKRGVKSAIIVGSQSQGRRIVHYSKEYLDGVEVQVVADDNDLIINPRKIWEEGWKLFLYRHKGDL